MQPFDDAWRAFIEGPLYADTDSPWRALSWGSAGILEAHLSSMDVGYCPMRS